ncbi:hypothetical protein HDU93_002090 [Gonapodya sp. JEL0774]|nr:hypothetical protein HDU93_002090 [Gonapodya sp. JEL0774]
MEKFPLAQLPPELLLRVSLYWIDHPFGLPTDSLNKFLISILSDPFTTATRAITKRRNAQLAFVYEVQRSEVTGDFRVPDVLLTRGANVNITFEVPARSMSSPAKTRTMSPLIYASVTGAVLAVRYLCERGAIVLATTGQNYSAMEYACCQGNNKVASELLRHGVTSESHHAHVGLILACAQGYRKVVAVLLQAGVNPDHHVKSDGQENTNAFALVMYRPLVVASKEGKVDIVRLLLAYGAKVDSDESLGPLTAATDDHHVEIVRVLLDAAQSTITPDAIRALHRCTTGTRNDILHLLLAKGVSVMARDTFGATPLHYAATREVAEIFLSHGADIQAITTTSGFTPLHTAIINQNSDMVAFLLDNGSDANARCVETGSTPVDCVDLYRNDSAVSFEYEEMAIMRLLDQRGLRPITPEDMAAFPDLAPRILVNADH